MKERCLDTRHRTQDTRDPRPNPPPEGGGDQASSPSPLWPIGSLREGGNGRGAFGCDILFIVGPSAAGKSAVAVETAKRLNGEIVSCDAMQVYREIEIASDKPSPDMLRAVSHHLIGVVSIAEEFSVARYRELALAAIRDIQLRGKRPIVCGGSGMYMMTLLDGIFEGGEPDPAVRARLAEEAEKNGLLALFDRLRAVDPEAAAKISPNDLKRIVRALEVFETTGQPLSVMQKKRDGLWGKQEIRVCALTRPREELYARAEARVEAMFGQGLVEEVRGILAGKVSPMAERLIGIPEVRGFLEGGYGLDRAKYLMKLNTRHYIKRQMTWFRKDQRIEWTDIVSGQSAGDVAGIIEGKLK